MNFHDSMGRIFGLAVVDLFLTLVFVVLFVYYSYDTPNLKLYIQYFIAAILISIPIHVIFVEEPTALVRFLKLKTVESNI